MSIFDLDIDTLRPHPDNPRKDLESCTKND